MYFSLLLPPRKRETPGRAVGDGFVFAMMLRITSSEYVNVYPHR